MLGSVFAISPFSSAYPTVVEAQMLGDTSKRLGLPSENSGWNISPGLSFMEPEILCSLHVLLLPRRRAWKMSGP